LGTGPDESVLDLELRERFVSRRNGFLCRIPALKRHPYIEKVWPEFF
jgi:hypothetical protein